MPLHGAIGQKTAQANPPEKSLAYPKKPKQIRRLSRVKPYIRRSFNEQGLLFYNF